MEEEQEEVKTAGLGWGAGGSQGKGKQVVISYPGEEGRGRGLSFSIRGAPGGEDPSIPGRSAGSPAIPFFLQFKKKCLTQRRKAREPVGSRVRPSVSVAGQFPDSEDQASLVLWGC